jgi:hypothetical protein
MSRVNALLLVLIACWKSDSLISGKPWLTVILLRALDVGVGGEMTNLPIDLLLVRDLGLPGR